MAGLIRQSKSLGLNQ
uniref:Uncharacterized protein n=1 Tax=Rhizophora mucronata TaxID=61149 RepID=A0A2P2QBB3_RHIMU